MHIRHGRIASSTLFCGSAPCVVAKLGHLALSRFLLLAAFSTPLWAFSAAAQLAPPLTPPPAADPIDENGVNVVSRKPKFIQTSISIGRGPGSLTYNVTNSSSGLTDISGGISIAGSAYTVWVGPKTETFTQAGGVFVQSNGAGSSLAYSSATQTYTYSRSDGAVAVYGQSPASPTGPTVLRSFTYPAGERLDYYHEFSGYLRPLSVASSLGYQIRYTYSGGAFVKATVFNMADETCDPAAASCTLVGDWPNISMNSSGALTNSGNAIPTYQFVSSTQTKLVYPSGRTKTYNFDSTGLVTTVSDGKGTWTYNYPNPMYGGTTLVFPPDSPSTPQIYDWSRTTGVITRIGVSGGPQEWYTYDANNRVTRVDTKDINGANVTSVRYTYDSRGNITELRTVSTTPGSLADLVVAAGYPATCVNTKICNKPEYIIDANGSRTDYQYDAASGNVAIATSQALQPAGVRAEVRYSYSPVVAQFKDGGGALISGSPFYRLTEESRCMSAQMCAGTSDEVRTTTSYSPQTAGLPVTITTAGGTGTPSQSLGMTYYPTGQAKSLDGPLPGTADTTRNYYDAMGRVHLSIGPDPDGSGPLMHRALRREYNADGQLISVSVGTATDQSDAALAGFLDLSRRATTYDAQGRAIMERVSSGGTVTSVQQSSYTNAGLVECIALRMNPATYSSLPSSACAAATAGTSGPDRITRYTYDGVQRPISVTSGYLTAEQSTEWRSYDSRGNTSTVTDAENNRTTYEYDGHMRLSKVSYPLAAKGSGASSATDYEQFTYDGGGKLVTQRTRSGSIISFTYDGLGRLLMRNLPGTDPDVQFAYNLLGQTTSVTQPGYSLTYTYDALGRNLTATSPLGTIGHDYDVAGRLIRRTWPDGFYITYDYLLTGEIANVRETGAVSGPGVLASYSYNALGNTTLIARGNGVPTTFTYGSDGLLSSMAFDPTGTVNDLTMSYAYSPSADIIYAKKSNDAYAWPGHINVVRPYTSSGHNQLLQSGGVTLGYNADGNLASSGTTIYAYNSEGLLTSSQGIDLSYDPLARLSKVEKPAASVATQFLWDGKTLIAEYDGSGVLSRRYVHAPSEATPIVSYDVAAAQKSWNHTDERGSVVATTDASGNVPVGGINSYDAYGTPATSNTGRFQFAGHLLINDIGLYYANARMYSPNLGVFMQRNPYGYLDGMNQSVYAAANPINRTDPSGLWPECRSFPFNFMSGYILVTAVICYENGRDPSEFAFLDKYVGMLIRSIGDEKLFSYKVDSIEAVNRNKMCTTTYPNGDQLTSQTATIASYKGGSPGHMHNPGIDKQGVVYQREGTPGIDDGQGARKGATGQAFVGTDAATYLVTRYGANDYSIGVISPRGSYATSQDVADGNYGVLANRILTWNKFDGLGGPVPQYKAPANASTTQCVTNP